MKRLTVLLCAFIIMCSSFAMVFADEVKSSSGEVTTTSAQNSEIDVWTDTQEEDFLRHRSISPSGDGHMLP